MGMEESTKNYLRLFHDYLLGRIPSLGELLRENIYAISLTTNLRGDITNFRINVTPCLWIDKKAIHYEDAKYRDEMEMSLSLSERIANLVLEMAEEFQDK